MTSSYNRSPVLSFYELPEVDRVLALKDANTLSHAEERMYVEFKEGNEYLPLDMFVRSEGKVWDGVYGMTAFSAYYIKLSKCGSECVVGYRYF